jgi:hypothetical protein
MWRSNTRVTAFFGSSRKVGEPARAGCTVGAVVDFQVTAEKCRDCDGLKVLSWTEGFQGAVVHQLCRLSPLNNQRPSGQPWQEQLQVEVRVRVCLDRASDWLTVTADSESGRAAWAAEPQTLRLRVLVSDSELASRRGLLGVNLTRHG